MPGEGVVGSILVVVATVVTAFFTRRTSKEGNAVTGFRELMTSTQAEMARMDAECTETRQRLAQLERATELRRQMARQHERWDWRIMRKLEEVTGESFPDPPPLDIYPEIPQDGKGT